MVRSGQFLSEIARETDLNAVLREAVKLDVAPSSAEGVRKAWGEARQQDAPVKQGDLQLLAVVTAPHAEKRIGRVVTRKAVTWLDIGRVAPPQVAIIADADHARPVGEIRASRRVQAGAQPQHEAA